MSDRKKIIFNTNKPVFYLNSTMSQGHFTKREWDLNNIIKYKNAEDQQKIAERIIGECERIQGEAEERTLINKETTERRLTERIEDILFNAKELEVQRKETCLELEALGVYKTRLIDCMSFVDNNALKQCSQCIMIRKGRTGIDLVVDDVEIALNHELGLILHWQNNLEKAADQVEECMRRIRAARYALDVDLEYKEHTAMIERDGVNLKPSDLSLMISKKSIMDPANITKAEWEKFSAKNIAHAVKEVSAAHPVRVTVDNFLQQIVEELKNAHLNTNRAFNIRILEIKKAKSKLEDILSETISKIEGIMNTIKSLEKALNDKMPYIALVQTRMGKRALRPGIESVKDAVCQSLNTESEMLKLSTEKLQRALEEAQTVLRYLLQTQVQLEEEINIKTNSIKIDEVECMTIRESMNFQSF